MIVLVAADDLRLLKQNVAKIVLLVPYSRCMITLSFITVNKWNIQTIMRVRHVGSNSRTPFC